MDINNKARIHWACRRGMRELDIHISPFGSAIWPLCLIAIGFWYTTRKVIARIEIVTR